MSASSFQSKVVRALAVATTCASSVPLHAASNGATVFIRALSPLFGMLTGALVGTVVAIAFVFFMIKSYADEQNGPHQRGALVISLIVTVTILTCCFSLLMALSGNDVGLGALSSENTPSKL